MKKLQYLLLLLVSVFAFAAQQWVVGETFTESW